MRYTILAVACSSAVWFSCDSPLGALLPSRTSPPSELDGFELVARIAHLSDTHVVDEESPARFPGAQELISSAWRPYEGYSSQLMDGVIRSANRIHAAGRHIDFAVITGDTCDNAQKNELNWFVGVLDGQPITPRSGPDDRAVEDVPDPALDPHHEFTPQGIYRNGTHGDSASIPWYVTFGNHDAFSIGVFAIQQDLIGNRIAMLPLPGRPGIVLPVVLIPTSHLAYGKITPAMPGPPRFFQTPQLLQPVAERAFFDRREYIAAMFDTITEPRGHGFVPPDGDVSWYSTAPVPGLRLIGLDTCRPAHQIPGFPYSDGSINPEQVAFLKTELASAAAHNELVIVSSHHPSHTIQEIYGTALTAQGLRDLLNSYPNVIAHLAGHTHRNRVSDHSGYIEIETCSTLDLPQEGRIVEIWRNAATSEIIIQYEMFSHLDDELPPLGDDPLRAMRQIAFDIATQDRGATARQKAIDPSGAPAAGEIGDRFGRFHKRLGAVPLELRRGS